METSSCHSGSAGPLPSGPPTERPTSIRHAPPLEPIHHARKRNSDRNVVSGRSLKRLRIDQTLITVPSNYDKSLRHPANPFDAQSLGTLSVGTMGGDLESNDEDTGNYEEDEEEMSASQSSWVASLPSLNSRRRMPNVGFEPKPAAVATNAAALDENDDAATCAEMTTAAIAPRKRTHCRSKRKPFLNGENQPRLTGPSNGLKVDNNNNDLIVEEIELDSMVVLQQPVTNVQTQRHSGELHHSMSSPPVECIPDPLLVAAQHAAVRGNGDESNPSMNDGTALFVGECYSSVTEEETSLAEDEASLSAISVGGNTITSFGGTTMASSQEGVKRCLSGGSELGWNRNGSQEMANSMKDAEWKPAPPPAFGHHNANNAMQQHEKAVDSNSLNYFLGSLHKERKLRQTRMHSSPHRRESSYHSLGSVGVHSTVSGNSHQSCPNYVMNFADGIAASSSWKPRHIKAMPPAPTENTSDSGDMDFDMEEVTGSTSSVHCSRANSVNTSQSGSERNDDLGPKWRRRVKLPSHSSLY